MKLLVLNTFILSLLVMASSAVAGDKFQAAGDKFQVAGDKFDGNQQATLDVAVRQLQVTVEALKHLLVTRGVATAAEVQELTAPIQAQ